MKHSFKNIPLKYLRERAFNSRWAEQPAGVIPLTAADPDFPVCPAIQDALVRYIKDGVLGYTATQGLPQFLQTVADWFYETRMLDCTPDSVLAIDSAANAMAVVARASLRAGDEVLIPDPVDFLFRHTIERAGAKAVGVKLSATCSAEEFIANLQQHIGPRTRMLWLCNPHNPLGVVYSRAWLLSVADWAVRNKLRILSDEVWSDIVFTPYRHTSLASLSPEVAKNTVTCYGFSKNFGLAGLRIGCIVCTDSAWRKQIVGAADVQSTVAGASVLSQVAVIAALRFGRDWLSDFLDHLQTQRNYVVQRLSSWPGVTTHIPQGTYVAFPCINSLTEDSERYCTHLLNTARVALVPGTPRWFGPNAKGHLRICFATSHRILQSAFDRLEPIVLESAFAQHARSL